MSILSANLGKYQRITVEYPAFAPFPTLITGASTALWRTSPAHSGAAKSEMDTAPEGLPVSKPGAAERNMVTKWLMVDYV